MKKNIIYHLLVFVGILNVLYMYIGWGIGLTGFTYATLLKVKMPIIIMGVMFFSLVLVNASYRAVRVIAKKNLLRVSGILMFGLTALSVGLRIREIIKGEIVAKSSIFATGIYLLMLIVIIFMLKELFVFVQNINKKSF